jgi:AcrR family transcriptional regulator
MCAQKKSEKYIAILKTTHDLFWKYGIRRVSVEEICREAGVSKMTFYRFFPNKTELTKQVINDLFDKIMEDYGKLMKEEIPFEEKIRRQLIMKFEGTNEVSAELVKDIYGNLDNEVYKLWKLRADDMLKAVINDYHQAQKKGWIRKDIKPEFMLYIINKTTETASDEKLQGMYPSMQSLIMEIANMFFYGIMPRTKQ